MALTSRNDLPNENPNNRNVSLNDQTSKSHVQEPPGVFSSNYEKKSSERNSEKSSDRSEKNIKSKTNIYDKSLNDKNEDLDNEKYNIEKIVFKKKEKNQKKRTDRQQPQ